MDPTLVNSFLDQFLTIADSGFGLIRGDVTFVLNALIVISITLAGAQWALAGEAPLAPFFRKVLFVGLFAFLINNWPALTTAIAGSGAQLGLAAGGSGLSMADLHNPGRLGQIGVALFGRVIALTEGMNLILDFVPLITTFLAAFFVMLGFFVLALQMFVTLVAFKLGALATFIALPWGVFSGTAWIAERPLGWVAASALRLFILAFVASVSIAFVDVLPATLTLEDGGALNVLLFGLTVLALAWFGPQLANDVAQGQPSLAGNDAYRAGVGLALTGAGASYLAVQTGRAGLGLAGRGAEALSRLGRAGGGGGSTGSGGAGADAATIVARAKPASAPAAAQIDYAAMRLLPRPSNSKGQNGDAP
jgi:type IV secretion system protein TrbL